MPSYTVSRKKHIKVPAEEAITFLKDFRNWPSWSPWLIMEPECSLDYSEGQGVAGAAYQWDGDLVGAGNMALVSVGKESLSMDLAFVRPFKSLAQVSFKVTPQDNGCLVEWTMDGSVPWFLFFLKKFFKSMISMDYDRGLRMLKSKLEADRVDSLLNLIGKRDQKKIHYVGLKAAATLEELGPVMQQQIEDLTVYFDEHKMLTSGELFTYYQSMDIHSQFSEFITCMPVAEPVEVNEPFVSGTVEAAGTYVVSHTGDYEFLGNAWAMAMMASRHNKIKVKRKPLGMERYLNSPAEVAKKDLQTEVILFLR